ncbi:MAG TPA: DUF3800 domain-containing protein [Gaiellaceae bacterium]|nr:DUF3800 domain-containing protein [Gaiellaceae bacterium]
MADKYVFADEAGNFDFSSRHGATRYFVLSTVTVDDPSVGNELLALRRTLAWEGVNLDRAFHATTEQQVVRDRVYDLLADQDFRVDATIFEKRKALPRLHEEERFYQMVWWLHFKFVAPQILSAGDRLLVTAASLGTKKKRADFHNAVRRVAQQVVSVEHQVAFWPHESDPCLQVADYCTWAIQRKWESGDDRSHVLIADKIASEFDVWQIGETTYY